MAETKPVDKLVAAKASDEPQGKTSDSFEKKKKPGKPKRNPNIPAPQPGMHKVMIQTTFTPLCVRREFEPNDDMFMETCQMVHDVLAANFKELKEDGGQTTAFLGRLALAKQKSKSAILDGSFNPDIQTISNFEQEVPAPIFIGASQIGYIRHEGVDHYMEDSESQALKQLLLCAAQVKVTSQEQSDALPLIEVDFDAREFSVVGMKNNIAKKVLAVDVALAKAIDALPTQTTEIEVAGFKGPIKWRPTPEMFIGRTANIDDLVATNAKLIHAAGWTKEVLAEELRPYLETSAEDRELYQSAMAIIAAAGARPGAETVSFATVYAKISDFRKHHSLKILPRLSTKVKMLDISALNGRGTLAQFVHSDHTMENYPRSAYALASDDAAYGLFYQFGADTSSEDWMRDRFEWNSREDLDNAKIEWIRSFLLTKSK